MPDVFAKRRRVVVEKLVNFSGIWHVPASLRVSQSAVILTRVLRAACKTRQPHHKARKRC